MRDEEALLLILWAIYLIETWIWLPNNGLLFSLTRRTAARVSGGYCGNASGSLQLNHLIPYRQLVAIAQQPAFLFHASGLSTQTLQHWSKMPASVRAGQTVDYCDIKNVSREHTWIKLNGKRFANCQTEASAARHVEIVEKLISVPSAGRETIIREYYAQRFPDPESVLKRCREIETLTHAYRVTSSLFFVYAFVACPIGYYFYPSPNLLLFFLLSSVLFGWILSALFYRSHKKIFPKESHLRFQSMLKQAFCFPVAAGSGKDLSLHAFTNCDPLVLGKATLTEADFTRLAREVWLDLKYPVRIKDPDTGNSSIKLQRELTAEFLKNCALDLLGLEQPIGDLPTSTLCYCPRCHEQFSKTRETCSECPGVSTIPTNSIKP